MFVNCPHNIALSLFVHFLIPEINVHESCKFFLSKHSFNDIVVTQNTDPALNIVTNQSLLLLSGDIETNPGPLSPTDLQVMHINICSIRNKIDIMEAEYNHLDVITVSETWLSESDSNDSIHLSNFHPPIRLDRPNDPHGGVAIYIKNNLICKPRGDLHVDGLEAVWVETKLNQNSLLIGSYYRPPNSPVNYWNLLENSIHRVNNTGIKFILLGDLNTDFLNSPSRHLMDILTHYNLTQLVNEPTRITEQTSTCIDLIITQSPDIVSSVSVLPAICSDHSVPFVSVKNTVVKEQPFKRTIFNYNKLDKTTFCNLLQEIDWNEVIYNTNIDNSAVLLSEIIMSKAKLCMPVKTVKIRPADMLIVKCICSCMCCTHM